MIIAQATDIHAGINNDNLARFEKVVAWLSELMPDYLVISGDLVDDGWLEGYTRIGEMLRGLRFRALVIPGNADHKNAMRFALPDFLAGDTAGPLHFWEYGENVLLLGLDVTIDGAAYGDVTAHLPWLRQKLEEFPTATTLLFTHHHIFASGISPIDSSMCRGVDQLAELLAPHGHRITVASGHVHRAISSVLGTSSSHVCGSICPANPLLLRDRQIPRVTDPPGLMVHNIVDRRVVSHHVSVS